MKGLRCVRSGGLPAASEARSFVLRSPQPSACCLTLKPGNCLSNSAIDVSWITLTVCGSTSVCHTVSSRTCWPIAAGARPSATATAPAPAPARKVRRETIAWLREGVVAISWSPRECDSASAAAHARVTRNGESLGAGCAGVKRGACRSRCRGGPPRRSGELLLEERDRPLPGELRRGLVVAGRRVVVKAVLCARIEIGLVRQAGGLQGGFESRPHGVDPLVVLRVVHQERHLDLRHAGGLGGGAVIGHSCLHVRAERHCEIVGGAATPAESGDPELAGGQLV